MPEKTKNQPSSSLVNLAKSLLRSAATAPQIPGAGLANLLQQIYLNKIMPTTPAQRRPRPNLFPPVDLFTKSGQPFVMSDPSLPSQIGRQYSSETLGMTDRPEGIRFYTAEGFAPTEENAEIASGMALQNKMMYSPADSIRTEVARKLLGENDYNALLDRLLSNPNYFKRMQTL